MPIVFVHGVNTRKTPGYDDAVAARNALFNDVFVPAAGLSGTDIFNPYWGGHGAVFAFDLRCVPTGREHVEELGLAADGGQFAWLAAVVAASLTETPEHAAAKPPDENAVMLTLARHNFAMAMDALYIAAARIGDSDGLSELRTLAAPLAQYALDHQDVPPDWLADVQDDTAFFKQVKKDVAIPEADGNGAAAAVQLGLVRNAWNLVGEGATRLRHETGELLGKPFWNSMRKLLVPALPTFLGDIFVYIKARGDASDPGDIPLIVIDELKEAAKKRKRGDPLIVVGHSLGGVIAYDVLSGFDVDPPIKVDLFCTVGSQVALFEEMKAFSRSDKSITADSGKKVGKPACVNSWINIFDYNDILSYKLDPVFNVDGTDTGVIDYNYPTGDLLHAHGAYFDELTFYQRLGIRARKAGIT